MDEIRTRVRAYFHFENQTGHHWQDSVSNWLQAEQEERSLIFFVELGRRVAFIRDVYDRHHIALRPNQGLARALAEAEALGAGAKATLPYSRSYVVQLTNDAHVIYAFGGDLETVVNGGLNVSKRHDFFQGLRVRIVLGLSPTSKGPEPNIHLARRSVWGTRLPRD